MSRGARIAGVLALWFGALAVGLYFTSTNGGNDAEGQSPDIAAVATTIADDGSSDTAVTTPTAAPETSTTAVTTTVPQTTTTQAPATTTTTPAGARVEATLTQGQFSLDGVVPDETTAQQLVAAASIVYGEQFADNLSVDSQVAAQPWLAGASQAITFLPIIGDGTITFDASGVSASGTSPNEAALGAFSGALEAVLGAPANVGEVTITNLGFPSFNARRQGDTIVLSGALANEEIKAGIVQSAQAAYDNVVDELTIGDNLDVPYWSYTMPGVLQLFAAFVDYEINIENGITGGSLNAGANFEIGSAELNDDTLAILPIALGIMVRDPSLGIVIEGHTDSTGDAAFNLQLSERRAEAVADWLTAAGVDATRIRAVGFGESEPIADNSTSAGRALNRRVEFEFGPAAAILAP